MSFKLCKFCGTHCYEVPAQKGLVPCELCRERRAAEMVKVIIKAAYEKEDITIGQAAEAMNVSIEQAQEILK